MNPASPTSIVEKIDFQARVNKQPSKLWCLNKVHAFFPQKIKEFKEHSASQNKTMALSVYIRKHSSLNLIFVSKSKSTNLTPNKNELGVTCE